MAKRPNAKCDPYGQGGKRMSNVQVQQLLTTLHDDWQVIVQDKENGIDNTDDSHNQDQSLLPIVAIQRQFVHDDFLAGAHFVQKVAAVGVMHNHYPLSIELTRRIVQQQWQTCTYITCQTRVLEGLSTHDFHFAMVRTYTEMTNRQEVSVRRSISNAYLQPFFVCFRFRYQMLDVEVERPDVQALIRQEST